MASSQTKASERMEHLCCSLCLEVFRSPRILPCFHTFCLNCLEYLTRNRAPGGEVQSRFPCPECRTLTAVPPGGARSFQVNFYIPEEDLKRARRGLSSLMCDFHEKPLDFFCVSCKHAVCIFCVMTHHENHVIQDAVVHAIETSKTHGNLQATEEERTDLKQGCQAAPDEKQSLTESPVRPPGTLVKTEMDCKATQTETGKRPVSPPVVCPEWMACLEFTQEGGCLQTEGSDILLRVPPGAVPRGASVKVMAAVCAKVDQIRQVLQPREEEEIVSPLAEYCAEGNDFHFQRPVVITLEHALPSGFDVTRVNVYRVSYTEQGSVAVESLRHKESQPDPSGLGPPLPSNQRRSESPSFHFPSPGQVCITTDCFSGYVCTYSNCGLQQDCPVLRVMACSSHSKDECAQQIVIYTYIWDDRLNIKDFRKESGIGEDKKIQTTDVLPLNEDLNNSKLCFHLELIGRGARKWMRMRGSEACADDLFPFKKSIDIERVLSCNNTNCQARKVCSQPVAIVWALETAEECPPDASLTLRCGVFISHVPRSTLLSECFKDVGKMRMLFLEVKENTDGGSLQQRSSSLREHERQPRPIRQEVKRHHVCEPTRPHDSDDEDGYCLSSEDDSNRMWKETHRINNNVKHDRDENGSSGTTKVVDWVSEYPNNRGEASRNRHTSTYSDASPHALQRGALSSKCTQNTDPNVLPNTRDNSPTQINRTKRNEKALITDDISSSSDMLTNVNPYSSSSETDVKHACADRQSEGENGGDSSDDHYEEIADPTSSTSPPHHLSPSLPDRPMRVTLSIDPDRPQTHSIPSPNPSAVPPCLNVTLAPGPSQQLQSGGVEDAERRPCSETVKSTGTTGVDGAAERPVSQIPLSTRDRRVAERASEGKNGKTSCGVM